MVNFFTHMPLWQRDIGLLALLNMLIVLSAVPLLSDIAGILFLAILPGVLIQRLLAFKAKYVWERIVHTVGLSISFVMFAGLAVNTVFPVIGISRPLAQIPILLSFDVFLLCIIVANFLLQRETRIFFDNVTFFGAVRQVAPHLLFIVLPILAIAGATVLNNGESNLLAGVTICVIGAVFLYLISSDHLKHENFIVSALYFSALALLLISAMRSSHVVGWDVNAEYQVFQITLAAKWWSMSHFQDAYNACLSITLLPVMFSEFTHIAGEYIYKFLFQLIFALMPVCAFYVIRGLSNSRIAIIASVMIVGNVVFSHGMPALVRQEFGFLYFSLVLLSIFSSNLEKYQRIVIICIYGASIIVSHYSTTYITVFLLGVTVLLNSILSFAQKRFPKIFFGNVSHTIQIWYVIFLAVGTILWGVFVTGTSNNISGFVDHSRSNIAETFTYDTWSRAYKQIFTAYPHFADFDKYKLDDTMQFQKLHPDFEYYDKSVTKLELLKPVLFQKTSGFFGASVKMFSEKIFQVLKLILNNLLVIIGSFILLYLWFKREFASSEFILFSVSGFVAFGLILLLPDALAQYNIDRLYFQLLITWAMPSVIGGLFLLSYFRPQVRFFLLGASYVLLFFFYTSLIFSITGGSSLVSISNFGADYEKFYVQDSEAASARWLGGVAGQTPIFANSSGYLRLRSQGGLLPNQIFVTTLPSMIDRDSYVFLTRMNVRAGISTYLYYNEEYPYTAPIDFLNSNKNAIYDSGSSKIFR